ncbi:PPK2 family polyphosphate kinase [Jatrophihabitans sp. DSM 45814]
MDNAAHALLARGRDELAEMQELLWADDRFAVLVILQGMDAAGKGSTIKRITLGVDPHGVQVVSFKQPSLGEHNQSFLRRISEAEPPRGVMAILNRSHYEDVVTARVHPQWLDSQGVAKNDRGSAFWAARYEDINAFERHLDRNGTKVVKLFLHISPAEQKRRFIERVGDLDKPWKFSAAHVRERRNWDQYLEAYEDAITATSTDWAPWFVIPADNPHLTEAFASSIVVNEMRSLALRRPTVSEAERRARDEALRELAG